MKHVSTGVGEDGLFAAVCLAAADYLKSSIAEDGYVENVQVLEELEPAIERLRLGDAVGITLSVQFVYIHNRPITEPWEETTRTSTVHVEVQPNARLDAKVVLEWGWEWLPETQRKW